MSERPDETPQPATPDETATVPAVGETAPVPAVDSAVPRAAGWRRSWQGWREPGQWSGRRTVAAMVAALAIGVLGATAAAAVADGGHDRFDRGGVPGQGHRPGPGPDGRSEGPERGGRSDGPERGGWSDGPERGRPGT